MNRVDPALQPPAAFAAMSDVTLTLRKIHEALNQFAIEDLYRALRPR